MKKQSSIDWLNQNLERELKEFMKAVSTLDMKLILQYSERLGFNSAMILDKARKMHREEVEEAFAEPFKSKYQTFDEYYDQKFETK